MAPATCKAAQASSALSHVACKHGPAQAVTLHTSLGDLKAEIFCEEVPRTAENFLALAASGAYDGTLFHRNIRGFMIQGGDPTGRVPGSSALLSPLPPGHARLSQTLAFASACAGALWATSACMHACCPPPVLQGGRIGCAACSASKNVRSLILKQ